MSEYAISIVEKLDNGDKCEAWLLGEFGLPRVLAFTIFQENALIMDFAETQRLLRRIFDELPQATINVREIRIVMVTK